MFSTSPHRLIRRILLLTVILTGCGADPTMDEVSTAEAQAIVAVKPPTDLLETLVGQWMPTAYCECLFKQRSAFACRTLADDIYVMYVEQAGADSLRWSYITTHEGGPEAILGYDAKSKAFTHRPNAEEYLGYDLIDLRSIDANTMEFRQDPKKAPQRFQRVRSSDALLNEALFAGRYLLEGDTSWVQFTPEGRISGPLGFTHFTVLTDFTEGLDDRDIVFLHHGNYDWGTDAYHYQHDGEMLLLYPMAGTAEDYVYRMEDLKYRLERIAH
jgi:hypothetical protein